MKPLSTKATTWKMFGTPFEHRQRKGNPFRLLLLALSITSANGPQLEPRELHTGENNKRQATAKNADLKKPNKTEEQKRPMTSSNAHTHTSLLFCCEKTLRSARFDAN